MIGDAMQGVGDHQGEYKRSIAVAAYPLCSKWYQARKITDWCELQRLPYPEPFYRIECLPPYSKLQAQSCPRSYQEFIYEDS
jgi:hypothetical protein